MTSFTLDSLFFLLFFLVVSEYGFGWMWLFGRLVHGFDCCCSSSPSSILVMEDLVECIFDRLEYMLVYYSSYMEEIIWLGLYLHRGRFV